MAAQAVHANCAFAGNCAVMHSAAKLTVSTAHLRTFFIIDWLMGHATWLHKLCTPTAHSNGIYAQCCKTLATR
jgi:hypothetical protein